MSSKLLQAIGGASVAVLVVASITALMVVKDRVDVTIQDADSAARRGPDPIELARADVAELKDDLAASTAAVGERLQMLHDALEASASRRDEATRGDLSELARRMTELESRLDAMAAATVPTPDARLALRSDVDAPPASSIAPRVAPDSHDASADGGAAGRAPPGASAERTAPEGAGTKSFLSFTVPVQPFTFEGRQRLAIVPSLSRVGFDAKSTLHDFSGVTQKVEGELTVDLAHPDAGCAGEVRVIAASLDTGMEGRDAEMRERLSADRYASLRFEWISFAPSSVDASAGRLAGTARGKLTVRDVTREIAMPVRVSVDASKRVAIEGEMEIAMSDYGIEPPSQLGMIKVADTVKIWIALRARSVGRSQEGAVEH